MSRFRRRNRSLGISLATAVLLIVVLGMVSSPTAPWLRTPAADSPVPVGDLPHWRMTAVEDFTQTAPMGRVGEVYGDQMRGYDGLRDSSGRGIYSPDSVLSVSHGVLDFYLHMEDGTPRVASIIPFGYEGQRYGRYSIKFRADLLPGYKIAFMLWPTSDAWRDGEVDWPEGGLDGRPYGASAIRDSLDEWGMRFAPSTRPFAPTDMQQWHIATTEWTPSGIAWFWDGERVGGTIRPSAVPVVPMRWTLQTETETGPGSMPPDPQTVGHVQVDWIAQYAYSPPTDRSTP